jgi:2-polyprenyl-3-methyl-5-hydroxy-6-metoxy-1,4-benzoquinol methylase
MLCTALAHKFPDINNDAVKYMSGIDVNRFWKLGNHTFLSYRFVLEDSCWRFFAKSKLAMLDAGCGSRISSLSYVPRSVSCVGIDVSSENITESHKRAKIEGYQNFDFLIASITSLPFRSESFDVVLSADVLEHVKAKAHTIHEISRVCKSRGRFLGSTSNLLSPLLLMDCFLPRRITAVFTRKFVGETYERHLRFTIPGLLQTLIKAGFKGCRIKLLGYPPFKPWLYESSERLPWFVFLWIFFDTLTSLEQLRIFKETIVFIASKK